MHSSDLEASLIKSVEIAELHFGPDSPELGLCLMDLANFLENAERQNEAEVATNRSLDILRFRGSALLQSNQEQTGI